MQIYSFLFKWKKNCQPNFKKKVSLQFVRTVYVCSNQLVASFKEAKKNRMSQIENELETSRLLRDWYRIHKRELPWRESSDPYIIWISEIILQQTRVAQGMDYFLRFTERFPDVASLASAEEDEVLKYWQGLGYYSRARNLHAAAKDIMERFGGIFPERYEDVISLKGIGEYTAAAIVSFVWNQPYPVVDGNVFRVLSRLFAVDTPIDTPKGKKAFTELAGLVMDPRYAGQHNQAIMELGALQCVPQNPDCEACPLNRKRPGRVTGIFIIYTLYIKEKPGCPAGKGKTFGKDSTSFRLSKRTRLWILQSCRRRMLFVGCLQERAG